MRPLPTLLGGLVLLAGVLALSSSSVPAPSPPPPVRLEPLATQPFQATLVQETGSEVRTRVLTLSAADSPAAKLGSSLRALRSWLVAETVMGSAGETAWPRELGAPRVFGLGPRRAALDFPLSGTPELSAATELQLLSSLRRTAAEQGFDELFIMVGGRVPPTFLGQVALPQVLE